MQYSSKAQWIIKLSSFLTDKSFIFNFIYSNGIKYKEGDDSIGDFSDVPALI